MRIIRDSSGCEVSIPEHPVRVLSLCTTATDTILRLGAGSRLAGIDEYSVIVPGASTIPVLGKGSSISHEQVLARGVDLAIVWWFQDDVAQLLAKMHVPVVRLRCGRAAEVAEAIRLVGQCLGITNEANALAQSVSDKLRGLARTATNPALRIYLELYSPFKTCGGDTYINDLIELAGGRNVASSGTGSILLSGEQLLAGNPDFVILVSGFGNPEDFARRSGMQNLPAVKAGRVHVVPRYSLVAGAGLPEGVESLSKLIISSPQSK